MFLPLEPNILYVLNLAYPTQRRNREQIDSLLETPTPPNLDQASPYIGIRLQLGLVVLITF